jgi:dTDP-4-dehydrorhamnose 3,5-epimerase
VKFIPTELDGACIIEPEPVRDRRGSFTRTFCARQFAEHGLESGFVQCSTVKTHKAGTVRGMHYQLAPHEEAKLVRCCRGRIYDVIVDLRPDSPGYCRWQAFELPSKEVRLLYVPPGFAHGYQTLEPDTEVLYWMSSYYEPAAEAGVRWNDPFFGIKWPLAGTAVSAKDRQWPDFKPQRR